MKNNLKVPSELLSFLDRQIGKSWWLRSEISTKTRLFEDLKIDGDDAVDFFLAFEKEFKVYISGFNMRKYFNAEGFDPVGISKMIGLIIGRTNTSNREIIKSINLGHLIKSIKKGRLDDSIIDA